MRLFHVSEQANIGEFVPRCPARGDLDPAVALVWAIDEARLPNYLTPRDCPRVTYHVGEHTTQSDREMFFTSSRMMHTVIIESSWQKRMSETTLYFYEFASGDFALQDAVAGYYVAKTVQKPKEVHVIDDLFAELARRHVEVRIVDNLWEAAARVKRSTLNWSLCRMGFAKSDMK